jgi:hypothetical protein
MHENQYFKISLVCLLPFFLVIQRYLSEAINRQQKNIYHPKENQSTGRCKKISLGGNYLKM